MARSERRSATDKHDSRVWAEINGQSFRLQSRNSFTGDEDCPRTRSCFMAMAASIWSNGNYFYPNMEERIVNDTVEIRDRRREALRISDGRTCGVAEPLEYEVLGHTSQLLRGKWKARIIRALVRIEPLRFSEIRVRVRR